uniref:Tetraspanin n=1 Tax=Cynoglossus semilaevis TaxID=244447 RepID=A0A3P8UMJ2_CYNSE
MLSVACLKTFLISYSLMFWITGVILLAVGVWGKINLENYFPLPSRGANMAPWVLVGTGVAVIIFGLFGCLATWQGTPWMLKLYALFSILVFLLEIAAAIGGFIFRQQIKAMLGSIYTTAINTYDGKGVTATGVDTIQKTLRCCGVHFYHDWNTSSYFTTNGIPTSCCSTTNCPSDSLKDVSLAQSLVYNEGCFSLITNAMESNLAIVGGISIGFAFFHLLGIFLACYFSRFMTAKPQP